MLLLFPSGLLPTVLRGKWVCPQEREGKAEYSLSEKSKNYEEQGASLQASTQRIISRKALLGCKDGHALWAGAHPGSLARMAAGFSETSLAPTLGEALGGHRD